MPENNNPIRPRNLAALLLGLITVAIYWPVASFPFISLDDPAYLTENPIVRKGLTARGIAWALTSTDVANWHPLTWLSHMIDVSMFGLAAGPHHVVNVLFHIANAVLLFFFLSRWTGATWRPAIVAALFAVHPLHVESVAWIAERKDVLSTLLMLLALDAYCRQASKDGPKSYTGALCWFVLGLMAKPMLVTLPFLLLLLDLWPLGRFQPGPELHPPSPGTLLKEKIPFFILSALSVVVTIHVQKGATLALKDSSMGDRIANALTSYVAYIAKTAWPANLVVLYPFDSMEFPLWKTILCAAALLAVSVASVREWKRRPWLAAGWFWYLGTLVPVIGLLPVGAQAMADRYTYIPSIGLFIAAVWLAGELPSRFPAIRHAAAAIAVAAIAAFGTVAFHQVGYWKDSVTLFEHTLAGTSGNWLIHSDLGIEYAEQKRYDEAIAQYREALRFRPDFPDAHYNLAADLEQTGNFMEAAVHYREVLRLTPRDSDAAKGLVRAQRRAIETMTGASPTVAGSRK